MVACAHNPSNALFTVLDLTRNHLQVLTAPLGLASAPRNEQGGAPDPRHTRPDYEASRSIKVTNLLRYVPRINLPEWKYFCLHWVFVVRIHKIQE